MSNEEVEESLITSTQTSQLSLEYGNIIRIIAKHNSDLHENTFFVDYIDDSKIKLIQVSSLKPYVIRIAEDGQIADESINEIQILSRADTPSYARQNRLFPKTWINIHFGGDIPEIITGEIINLEEDMIEITTYPDLLVMYIDFEYKGIPEDIPIDKIIIRKKPVDVKVSSLKQIASPTFINLEGDDDEEDEEEISLTMTDDGESIIKIPTRLKSEQTIKDALNAQYIDADDIIFGNKVEYVEQVVETRESERRYTLDIQINDLMDELLSTIPDYNRTPGVLSNIHRLIERFKELRAEYTIFDETGNARGFVMLGDNHKPLVNKIKQFEQRMKWLIPVVQTRRKLYYNELLDENEIDEIDEIPDVLLINNNIDITEQAQIDTNFKENPQIGEIGRYKTYLQRTDAIMTPFSAPLRKSNIINNLSNLEVATSFDAIIANQPDYYSTNIRSKTTKKGSIETIDKTQYIIQRYGLGATMMEPKSAKTVYVRNPVATNDKIYMKSLIMMPQSVVQFSKIDLPSTNIMERSSLSQDYLMLFRIFNSKLNIENEILDNFAKEYDYEKWEETEKKEFLSTIREFSLDESMITDKFTMIRFLETIIPKTRLLIRLIDRYLTDKMSIYEMIKSLEPFGIYSKDITYKQYNEMRYLIAGNANLNGKIRNYTKSLTEKKEQMSVIRNNDYRISSKYNEIDRLLYEKKALAEFFNDGYLWVKFDKSHYVTASDMIRHMLNTDYGILYYKLLQFMRMSLTIPVKFMAEINEFYNKTAASNGDDIEDMGDNERIKPESCARRYITKRYTSLGQLQKDNGEEIFYDTEFDNTPYDIMNKNSSRQKTMEPDAFKEWLEKHLEIKHNIPIKMVRELAENLIQKRKHVNDGEYAILEVRPELPNIDIEELSAKEQAEIELEANIRKKTKYYIRRHNNWVEDREIDPENMYEFENNNALFCNISEKCTKNSVSDACEDLADAKRRIIHLSRMGAKNELESRYKDDLIDSEKQLEHDIMTHLRELREITELREIQKHTPNNIAYDLGKMAQSADSIEISPHAQLLQYIIGQDDFEKKQNDIITFGETFCRDAREYEDQHWTYCRDTNIKLLPLFLFKLADGYFSNTYQSELDRICRECGVLSDDGDAFVDRYSGFVIRKIDFVAEEGYNEAGFKIVSGDIIEKDMAVLIKEALIKKSDKIFEDKDTQLIYNVLSAICENIGIDISEIEDFVLRTTTKWIKTDKDIMTPEQYIIFTKKIQDTKQKRVDTYEYYKNQLIIFYIAGMIHVAIQTKIPGLKTKLAPPAGCVRSFTGYPLSGEEDTTGIKFISCIVNKSKSPNINPWSAIQRIPLTIIIRSIRDIIQKKIAELPEIIDLYITKREYMTTRPDDIIPESLRLSQWLQFFPPIVQFQISSKLHAVSDTVKSDLLLLLRNGDTNQHSIIDLFKTNIMKHGLGVIELINTIVSKKDLILKTAANVPFLQNACCTERPGKTPMEYFVLEDPVILDLLKKAFKMAKITANTMNINRPSYLYDPTNTRMVSQIMPSGHFDENIYATYIHYLNFDNDIPIPDDLATICREKPIGYNPKWSLDEKIKFLKENGKRISLSVFEHLFKLIAKRNIVNTISVLHQDVHGITSKMMSLLEHLHNDSHTSVFEEPFIKMITNVVTQYNPFKMMHEDTESDYDLKSYLNRTNNNMYKTISDFLDNNGGLNKRDMDKINGFLSNIDKWSIDTDLMQTGRYYEEGFYSMTQFIQTSIRNMGKLYPNIIINNTQLRHSTPNHWDLSGYHNSDVSRFVADYYTGINAFKGDRTLRDLLTSVCVKVTDILLFVDSLPILTPIVQGEITYHNLFDKKTIGSLLKYAWTTIIYEMVVGTDDMDLIRVDTQIGKQTRREQIRDSHNDLDKVFIADSGITEQNAEYADDMDEVEITTGNIKSIKENAAKMIIAFLNIEYSNKVALDLPYAEIERKMNRSKMEEKKLITDFFKDMDSEERKVKNLEKQYKLGRWNVGLQKGLVNYDTNMYDRERMEIIDRLNGGGDGDNEVALMERDIYQMDADDAANIDNENGEEGINDLGEDYDDGNYYEEDRNDD